jgi:hypothetical protein
MLNSSFINDIGLFNGKMGIAITFHLLGRKENNEVYTDFGNDLLDEVSKALPKDMSIDFSSGLSGIGWGIEYLIQNHYVEGKSLEVCKQIDQKIIQSDPRRMNDISLEKGLWGLLHYIIIHLKGCYLQKDDSPFDSEYLKDLYTKTKDLKTKRKDLLSLQKIYVDYVENNITPDYYIPDITSFASRSSIKKPEQIMNCGLGIRKGLAGTLLK